MPNYYAEINQDGRVIGVSELAGEVELVSLIPITKENYENRNLLYTRFIDGKFIGLYSTLESDKTSFLSDGNDMVTLTVKVYNWENEIQSNYSGEIIFEVNGILQNVKASNGVSELTLSSEEPGEFIIRTVNLDRNGELKVVVKDAS